MRVRRIRATYATLIDLRGRGSVPPPVLSCHLGPGHGIPVVPGILVLLENPQRLPIVEVSQHFLYQSITILPNIHKDIKLTKI